MRQQTLSSLCTAIKVFVQKSDLNKVKSEKFKMEAGIRLHRLKARLAEEKPKNRLPWYEYVRKHCGLGKSRAHELMQIAEGHVTVEESQAKTTARSTKHRARSRASTGNRPLRNGRLSNHNDHPPDGFQDPAKVDTCDFNPVDSRPLEGEPYSVTRLRGYLWATREVIELAQRNLFTRENKANYAKLDPQEITDEVIQAAQDAADAWVEVVNKLRRWQLKGGRDHDHAETQNRNPLHGPEEKTWLSSKIH